MSPTDALGAAATGVRIALVAGTTLAGGAESSRGAVGVRSAREVGAHVVTGEAREARPAARST